jgi:hypothetical protein
MQFVILSENYKYNSEYNDMIVSNFSLDIIKL